MRRHAATGLVLVVLAAGGCSGGPFPAATTDSPSARTLTPSPATPFPSSPSPSRPVPTAPVGTEPVVTCLQRSYRLTRFTAYDPGATYRSGTGGDVELRFDGREFPDGNYVDTKFGLRAAGKKAMTLTTASGTASLVVEADATAFYQLANDTADFALGTGKASGRLTSAGTVRTLPLAEVLPIVAPQGPTTVSCTATTLYLSGEDVSWELRAL